VFPSQHIEGLVQSGAILAPEIGDAQVQPASLDLRLGSVAYQVRASVLPGKDTVLEAAEEVLVQELDLTRPQVLQRGSVYLIPAQESLKLPRSVSAKANPKSTTGRLDVFARLITDRAEQFDTIRSGYHGNLYIEVSPKTFNVRVREGTRLNQIRFLYGRPQQDDASKKAALAGEALVYSRSGEPLKANVSRGLWLTVDLLGVTAGPIGWRARNNAPVVDFDLVDHYEPSEFWEALGPDVNGRLILNPGDFYILSSRERVRVPPAYAAEMVPYDPAMGEFRAHYAGFFDPGFGYGEGKLEGTRAVLEVRSYDVPYLLRDGQNIARLVYEQLREAPEKLYGVDVPSSYQNQFMGLGKQFRRG
jgi:dCTP deaminase